VQSKVKVYKERMNHFEMRNLVLSLVLIFCLAEINAQSENKLVQSDKLTWFGIDCTKLKLIGASGTAEDIAGKYFMAWNRVVVTEREKYDFARFFQKSYVERDLAWISEQNDRRELSGLKGYKNQNFTASEVAAHVQTYQLEGEGPGLVIVLENFNKLEEIGTMWVVFFDIESKQVLFAKHMSAKPKGFGFRNYWVRTVFEVLKESGKQYKRWVKQYEKFAE